ncbi:fimbrial protein [Halomonas denitrificans]|uniref:fimbrial protein n=1 Tax=Halomonas TaxID=2745 RepID=UPI001A8C29D1|nr:MULTISPECIES: fimbrial protein [Halomonas]MED5294355.1 fimbrial protein [Pseudomonadota bacterium]MBN8413298.1 fimbrial protein [Halomonas litopenaei]MBY5928298.1 fimbrial protein [Halomonas sp. DP8Y7-3]MBY6029358.1 fimbrial protein [Halomonas sp. DP8Y7-1]MCA0974877.1 fimbrial protein [Halomonas denitrificans]
MMAPQHRYLPFCRRWLPGLCLLLALSSALFSPGASAHCFEIIPPWDNRPLPIDFGSEIVVDSTTAIGTPIGVGILPASQLYAINGGWVARCLYAPDTVKYWLLWQHYSATTGYWPIPGITSDAADEGMYVMTDSGTGNPYGGGGSGSVGYTTELMVEGKALPFKWTNTNPAFNLFPFDEPVHGIPCTDAKAGTGLAAGYPPMTSVCPDAEFAVNWRQMPPFYVKVTLYKLAGDPGVNGVTLTHAAWEGYSLLSLMNDLSTPPAHNADLFSLTGLTFAQPLKVRMNPCHGFSNVTVSLGKVGTNRFTELGQPPQNVPDTPVHVSAWCHTDSDIEWAVLGDIHEYDPSGDAGILALDSGAQNAKGVGIQLLHSGSLAPLPITPEGSAYSAYRWIDTNLKAVSGEVLMLDFLARYVKTGDVEPGTANGHATVVLAPK